MGVPTMLYALMDHPDSRTRDRSSLETVHYGASAINLVRQEAIERFGPIFAQYSGSPSADTHLLPRRATTSTDGKPYEKRLTSCGRPAAFILPRCSARTASPVAG